MSYRSTQHTGDTFNTIFPWGGSNTFSFFLHRFVIRRTINKKTRLTVLELHYCAYKARLTVTCSVLDFVILTFGLPAFTRHMEGNCTRFFASNEVYWMLYRYTIKENDHQWQTLHLLPRFSFLYSLCLPLPVALLTLCCPASSFFTLPLFPLGHE